MSSKVISKLTKAQEAQIPVYIDKWMNVPTKPMDKSRAEEAIAHIYSLIGKPKPMIIYGQSPLQTA